MDSAFIDDGWTDSKHIAAIPGLYAAVDVDFRPMISDDHNAFTFRTRHMQEDALREETKKELATRISGWSLKDRNGKPVPYTVATFARLRPPFFRKLVDIVFGFDPGDRKEREDDAKNSEAGSS